MSIQNHKRQLLALGTIDQKLHYGPFASNWWFELNQKEFIIRVVDNNWKPGYVCELDTEAIVYLTSSAAINETYKKYFNIKTQFSGPSILGFDNKVVAEQLCAKILFFLFQITVYGITIFVVAFGSSDQAEWNFAGSDWYQFFTKWKQQSTTIIEFSSHLASIYLADFVFTNTIVEVWRLIMQYVGCTNITPYKRKELDISNDLMDAARQYSRINGPGCIAISKPKITRSQISEVKDREFETFFVDKDNVSMSSYKVHSKTNLPILYLKDNKEALWKKYEATYPDGIKSGFENEIIMNSDSTMMHVDTINHCLLYAFGECHEQHTNRYAASHQARKIYLNSQFKARLAKLDNNGAILICDYKTRILAKSVRETKEQFCEKRGWSLHTILVFTNHDANQLNVQAFDY
ncbi:hypothetical protein C2G38_2218909 [Gigaspora rosea]|uniref:Uncharacterized protein n=1 Tax=Gigaspora rosea TaxID=44941 RepID=A0A397UAF9_9GLOM|nr:hypothetical protein C2G38_2218909 [Gigaspora rosea]